MPIKPILSAALASTFLGGCVLIDASTDAPTLSNFAATAPVSALSQQAEAQTILNRALGLQQQVV